VGKKKAKKSEAAVQQPAPFAQESTQTPEKIQDGCPGFLVVQNFYFKGTKFRSGELFNLMGHEPLLAQGLIREF
jgi:hypothetical protein